MIISPTKLGDIEQCIALGVTEVSKIKDCVRGFVL